MKRIVLVGWAVSLMLGGILALGAPSASQLEIERRLTGTWVGVSGHWGKENSPPESRRFAFTAHHECEATIGKETFTGTYRIAVSNEPFQIDFTFEVQGKKVTTLTIFDFPKDGQLRIAEWDPDWRRKEFDPGITFKKKESAAAPARAVAEAGVRFRLEVDLTKAGHLGVGESEIVAGVARALPGVIHRKEGNVIVFEPVQPPAGLDAVLIQGRKGGSVRLMSFSRLLAEQDQEPAAAGAGGSRSSGEQ